MLPLHDVGYLVAISSSCSARSLAQSIYADCTRNLLATATVPDELLHHYTPRATSRERTLRRSTMSRRLQSSISCLLLIMTFLTHATRILYF